MSGFCVECGDPLDNHKICPNGHLQRPAGIPSEPRTPDFSRKSIALPRPSTRRRLLGSGVEYFIYAILFFFMAAISFTTLGFFDVLLVPPLVLMIGLRDVHAGLFSIGKRISRMRVVEYGTGKPATNSQALLRNSYYMALTFLMIPPIILVDLGTTTFFMLLIVIDVILISFGKDGRRIGDWLARTQVVQEAKGA